MTKAADLADAIEAQLMKIRQADGYHFNIDHVFGFGERKPDGVVPPYVLVRINEDRAEETVANVANRVVEYEVEGVLSRSQTLRDLQLLHHDICRALALGQYRQTRPIKPGVAFEEGAVFEPDREGSTVRRVISTVTFRYVEKY